MWFSLFFLDVILLFSCLILAHWKAEKEWIMMIQEPNMSIRLVDAFDDRLYDRALNTFCREKKKLSIKTEKKQAKK